MLKKLAELADQLDAKGLHAEADAVDNVIKEAAEQPTWNELYNPKQSTWANVGAAAHTMTGGLLPRPTTQAEKAQGKGSVAAPTWWTQAGGGKPTWTQSGQGGQAQRQQIGQALQNQTSPKTPQTADEYLKSIGK